MYAELIAYLEREGYQNLRVLEDGSIVGTMELMYTRAIFMGMTRHGWEKRFCYANKALALTELAKLKTEEDVPTGYIARRGR